MSDRIIAFDRVKGVFAPPMFVKLVGGTTDDRPTCVNVSTVVLDDAHSEDHLGICEPETGCETMVFFGGTIVSCYARKYTTRLESLG